MSTEQLPQATAAPTKVLDPMSAFAFALSLYNERAEAERHLEVAHEQGIADRAAAELHLIEAAKKAALLLMPTAREQFLAELPVKVDLSVPASRPRLVIPKPVARTIETHDGHRVMEKAVITDPNDERIPLALRKDGSSRGGGVDPIKKRAVYCLLRRHPEGLSVVLMKHILDREMGEESPNIRTLGTMVWDLNRKMGLLGYKNGPVSKQEQRLHGRGKDGPLKVRHYFCVR